MKRWIAVAALMIGVASADDLPYLLGSVNNRANGQIYFTTSKTNCDEKHFAFIRGDGGEIQARGCYVLGNDFIIVIWDDGSTYTYEYAGFNFSREALEFMKRNK
jgi:hypothetical protein